MTELDDILRDVMASIFNVSTEKIDEDSSPDTIEAWDSLQHLNLVMAFEQTLGVRFKPEEIQAMRSFSDIREMIINRQARSN